MYLQNVIRGNASQQFEAEIASEQIVACRRGKQVRDDYHEVQTYIIVQQTQNPEVIEYVTNQREDIVSAMEEVQSVHFARYGDVEAGIQFFREGRSQQYQPFCVQRQRRPIFNFLLYKEAQRLRDSCATIVDQDKALNNDCWRVTVAIVGGQG